MIRVFVSSVSRGLEDIRQQIIDDLHTGRYGVVNMEAFGARPDMPLDVCLRELRSADVAVVIIGPRYGTLVPAGELSYTHREFREALARGIPVLAFKIPTAKDIDGTELERLDRFADEASRCLTYQQSAPDRLSAIIQASLTAGRDRGDLGPKFKLFQSWAKFFARQLATTPAAPTLFNHLSTFVGRSQELRQLLDFAEGDEPVFVLIAPGGAGKSRLLLELAKSLDDNQAAPRVLFVDAGAEWSADDIASLPAVQTLLIIDDAHRRPDLDRLISACQQHNDQLRFIVSCRPGALELVRPQLASLLTAHSANAELHLLPMRGPDAITLASETLGQPFAHLADRLVRVADLNPLVISVGARCIALHRVPPEVLDHSPEEFRRVVLDSLLRDPTFEGEDGRFRRKLLDLLATIGPVTANDPSLTDRMAGFLAIPSHDLNRMMADLEAAGFVQRRGRLLRVAPDVLADHLLYRAAVSKTGTATGYVDEVLQSFSSGLLANILANSAELDWRAAATASHDLVLTSTWSAILDELPHSTNRQRAELLNQLRRAAAFAPDRVLEIVEWVCDNPESPPHEPLIAMGLDYDTTQIRNTIIELLGFIATDSDLVMRCVGHLWQFALDDERPTGPNPSHPRRKLTELLSYDGRTPTSVQEQVLAFVIQRLESVQNRSEASWAVQMLGAVLERQGETTTATKRGITIQAFPLAPHLDRIRAVREAAMESLLRIGLGLRPSEAVAAIHELGELLRKPLARFGGSISDAEVASWLPEARVAVTTIQSIANESKTAIVRFLARRELRSASREHWPELAPELDAAVASTPAMSEEGFYDILVGMPWAEELDDWKAEQERVRGICSAAARAIWKRNDSAQSVVSCLLEAVAEVRQTAQLDGENLWMLAQALVHEKPSGAKEFVSALGNSRNEDGYRFIAPVIAVLVDTSPPDEVMSVVEDLGASESASLRAHAAESLRYVIRGDAQSARAALELIRGFARDSAVRVRTAAVNALLGLRQAEAAEAQEAVDVLVSVDWNNDILLAERVCSVLHRNYGIDPALLSDEQIDTLLGRIATLRTIEGRNHNLLQYISFASERRPEQTLQMLLDRIRAVDAHEGAPRDERWTPMPYNARGLTLPGLLHAANYTELLRRIRDAALDASRLVGFWLPELFHVAASDIGTGFDVLREWIQSGEAAKIVAATHLLRGFDHSIVFTQHVLVAEILNTAIAIDTGCLQRVESELFGLAISGVFGGSPGQPAPRHVADKAEALRLTQTYSGQAAPRRFYEGLVKHAESSIQRDMLDWESEEDDE